ncbi:NAD(P)-dependent sugar dehydrogenase [Desulfotomaculum nigrificans]|uniref:NAD(P)-dependent sugar dehydrogenase n=1 Tax=Desulfotomaculum nigrificans TaxID=1565 RepID=UPI0001FAEC8F|nr:NAD(P)-dependent sugar dehydrogenase [Desulfotomaculum nigrificans]
MKTALVKSPNKILFKNEQQPPSPGPQEALIRVRYCGVCGSDIAVAYHTAEDWTHIGHEAVGEVVAVGESVIHLKEGDSVAVECSTTCGLCDHCLRGRSVNCSNITNIYGKFSGFSEYICVPAKNVIPFQDLDFEQAVLIEPLSVALCMVDLADISINDDVLIIGPGPLGLMALATVKHMGARSVSIVGRSGSRARMALAKELGANRVISLNGSSTAEAVLTTCQGLGFDKILITAHPSTISDAVKLANPGAIISYIGYAHGKGNIVQFDADLFHAKHLTLKAYDGPTRCFPEAIDLLSKGVINHKQFVTHWFDLANLQQAITTAAEDKENAIKVIVKI